MKRFLILFLIIVLCSCSAPGGKPIPAVTDPLPDVGNGADSITEPVVTTDTVTQPVVTTAPLTEPPVTEPPEPVLPQLCFFFDDLTDTFAVMDSFEGSCVYGWDVGCFGVIPAVDGITDKSYRAYWEKAYSEYPELNGMRLGYLLEFYLSGGEKVTVDILCPDDTEAAYNKYLYVYIYDDVNQIEGQFYSHLLQWQVTDETLITSVKLTGGPEAYKVNRIVLTAFLYGDGGERFSVTDLPINIK